MYNQQQQNFQNSSMNFQQPSSQAQYRGIQKQYQPAGQVQSFYQGIGQSQNQFPTSTPNQSFQSQNIQSQGQIGQQTQFASPEQFHASNYQGNQPGHDNYLRADSVNPSQSQFGIGAQTGFQGTAQAGITNQFGFQGQTGQQNQAQYSGANPSVNQFHSANYRGNQAGHDNYLRADSVNPTQSQFGSQNQYAGQTQIGAQQFGAQQQFGGAQQSGAQQYGAQNQAAGSFHTANYQGNQAGHDSYLRADSTQPSNIQQQFGLR